jgi:hypothetical protein
VGWTPDHLLTAITLAGGAAAFLIGLLQYRKSQHWKRAEWVAHEMKAFLAAPLVQAALQMIDYPDRQVLLFPEREKIEDRHRAVTDQVVREALRPHDETRRFTDDEIAIRDAFDGLLDGLERWDSYVRTGLIADGDVRPYLDYWAKRILSPDPADGAMERLVALRSYMHLYRFDNATQLLQRLQEPPPPPLHRRLLARPTRPNACPEQR